MRTSFMMPVLAAAASATALLVAAIPAAAAVSVQFVQPDDFTDVPRGQIERDHVLDVLQRHFTALGAKLPAGRNLKVEILDLDMAGRTDPGRRSMKDVRIVRDQADWPSMRVRYALEAGGNVLVRGEESVSDLNYRTPRADYRNDKELQYEKKMIDDWFARTFLQK